MSLRYFVQHSSHPIARLANRSYRAVRRLSVPAPKVLVKPLLWALLTTRSVYHFILRVFYCEPLFKGYLASRGKNFHTGVFLHWVDGVGKIHVGDDVTIDGKWSFTFTSRYVADPTVVIGNDVVIGHGSRFTVGRKITIGDHVKIAGDCSFLDTSGHPTDPDLRRQNLPAPPEKVREIVIGRDVWIGQFSIILPGTRIGDGAVIAAGSVVRGEIPALSIVAGNPAKVVATLSRPETPNQPDEISRTHRLA